MLLLDVYKRAAGPALIEVEIFVYTMPFCWIELTRREWETASTCLDGDISDDCARVVCGKVVMYRGRKDGVGVVDDYREYEADGCDNDELDDGPDLERSVWEFEVCLSRAKHTILLFMARGPHRASARYGME